MIYDISAATMGAINFAPATELEEILQNLRCILATPKFSVPLDRDFGIDAAFIDRPMPAARAKIAASIIEAIKKYEPRVTVTAISWDGTIDGNLRPKVQVMISDS